MNRRAWFIKDEGVLIVMIEGDQIFIAIAGQDREPYTKKLPED